jgi:CheY-specific phosphatase CheX
MISTNAVAAIKQLFEQSLREHCVSGPEDQCHVTSLNEMDAVRDKAETREQQQLVVLNISSYAFRIVILFEFDEDAATTAHLAKISHRTVNSLQGQELLDTYSEFVNLICGKVNRDLGKAIFHSGLSTPFFLESTCAQYVSVLKPSHTHFIEALVNSVVRFKLTICICTAHDATIDFQVDMSKQAETSTGEMELF